MSITSLSFVVFAFLLLAVYYMLPAKGQWIVLLIASLMFYISFGMTLALYVMLSFISVFFSAILIDQIEKRHKDVLQARKSELTKEQRKALKKKNKSIKKAYLSIALLIVFLLLVVFKYSHFLIEIINSLTQFIHLKPVDNTFSLIVPLGISYYSLQAAGYLIDVYWGKISAERNPFKLLLFITFFPQITQGPIDSYEHLSAELFREHRLTYRNFSWGVQRMIWGFFKKMVVADALAPYVVRIFTRYAEYSGITCIVGTVLYIIQLYADFSGYMDIMCGYCEMLDIKLAENFERPFFSKSVSEFWRRWHITLGRWARTYIFYPVAVSKWNQKISRSFHLNESFSGKLATTIPLLFVWLFVGLWHDASFVYVLWGLGNAVFIISGVWLEPFYSSMKEKMHIRVHSTCFKVFQVARTAIIFSLLEVIAAVSALGGNGYHYVSRMVSEHSVPRRLSELFPSAEGLGGQFLIMLIIALLGSIVIFLFSLVERKKPVREYFNKLPLFLRILLLVMAVMMIASSGVQASWGAGAFMYANF